MNDIWIWLPKSVYPENQTTRFDEISRSTDETYVVAEFKKVYTFEQKIAFAKVRFSADTEIQLFCNDTVLATGPSTVGGDFLGNGKAREWYYADEAYIKPDGSTLDFFARVKMCPTRSCEFSKGHGGFMLCAEVVFADGSHKIITTDDSWLVRKNGAYARPLVFDGRIAPDGYVNAEIVPDIWNVQNAPIPVRSEEEISVATLTLAPHEESAAEFSLDMIYAGFLHMSAETDGTVFSDLTLREMNEKNAYTEKVILTKDCDFRSFYMHSAGNIVATIKNESDTPSVVKIGFIATCYPVDTDAKTVTSDKELNDVLEVCKHTLKYCRQTHHLDSPRHCEPLACTGDYYIESMMTAFSFGDMRLAEFDIERTAELLRHNDGRIFHTTYSLIWVRMLYDVYMISGNRSLLETCRDALDMLLNRFLTYIGDNSLIENPPDYMFIDWIYIDGISMHHPPKALGQTVLNMFYYMALTYAQKIYSVLCDGETANSCKEKAEKLKNAINTLLYDKEKGMYFEGLNTPSDESLLGGWHPQNVEKRYYLKQSNIMAAYTSVCDDDTAVMLIHKIMSDEIEGGVQPYFMHYLFEAIYSHNLRDKYTLSLAERWKAPVRDCPKGLAEGFIPPEPTYRFDHSHAWGGTPLYSVPKALIGLSIEEAGCKKIKLRPSLLGLDEATVELPTPYGMVICKLKKGCEAEISAPEVVEVILCE